MLEPRKSQYLKLRAWIALNLVDRDANEAFRNKIIQIWYSFPGREDVAPKNDADKKRFLAWCHEDVRKMATRIALMRSTGVRGRKSTGTFQHQKHRQHDLQRALQGRRLLESASSGVRN